MLKAHAVAVFVGLLAIGVEARIAAQSALPATPPAPDLLGIYPGMPERDARAVLQRHSADYQVQTNAELGFTLSITDPSKREMVEVFVTQEPNPSAVWMIRRSQNFSAQNPMSPEALLRALRDKYGQATLTQDRGGALFFQWIFDAAGRLLASADASLMSCSGSSFVTNIRTGPDVSPSEITRRCYSSFFAVTASLNRRDAGRLEAYSVELVNLPYAVRAATITQNAKTAAADRARKDDDARANGNRPKF